MSELEQKSEIEIPVGSPMNLTCQPVKTIPGDATTKYAIVMDGDGDAQPPPGANWTVVFLSNEDYRVTSSDGSCNFTIPAGGLGIYSK